VQQAVRQQQLLLQQQQPARLQQQQLQLVRAAEVVLAVVAARALEQVLLVALEASWSALSMLLGVAFYLWCLVVRGMTA
jgi:hypothetical protein